MIYTDRSMSQNVLIYSEDLLMFQGCML